MKSKQYSLSFSTFILVALFSALRACGQITETPRLNNNNHTGIANTLTASAYPYPIPVATSIPYPGSIQATHTPELPFVPTPATPPGPPTIPVSWATYTHPILPIQFRYPPDWSRSTDHYEGPDGFFEVRVLTSPPSVFDLNSTYDKIGTHCVLEANGQQGAVYGTFPPILDWRETYPSYEQGRDSLFVEPHIFGCVIMATLSDGIQPGSESVLFARFPPPWPTDQVLEFRSDAAHFESFLSSLRLIEYTLPGENVGNPLACQERPDVEPLTVIRTTGLVISETALANGDCAPWTNYDDFQALAEQSNQSRSHFKEIGEHLQMEANNRVLAQFGYHIEEVWHEPYGFMMHALYQGESIVVDYILDLEPVSVNAAGNNFLLWLNVMSGEPPSLSVEVRRNGFRRDGSRQYESLYPRKNSVWIGEQVFSYETQENWQEHREQPMARKFLANRINVKRDNEVIFEMAVPPSGRVYGSRRFWAWEGHWLLEMNNVLVQDGELLNTQIGYDEIFEWHLVKGQPLYFYRHGLEYGLSYGGETLPISYEDIIHGDLWDKARVYGIISTLQGTDFFAQRDGVWYHVTITYEL